MLISRADFVKAEDTNEKRARARVPAKQNSSEQDFPGRRSTSAMSLTGAVFLQRVAKHRFYSLSAEPLETQNDL